MSRELKAFCSLSECNKEADIKCADCENLVCEETHKMTNDEAPTIIEADKEDEE